MTEANTDSERESIDITLGEGATIDGGPFFNAEIEGVENGRVVYRNDGDGRREMEVRDVAAALIDEVESGEPIRVIGIHPTDGDATISLPLVDGMDVEAGGQLMTAEALCKGNVPDEWIDLVENSDVEYFPQ